MPRFPSPQGTVGRAPCWRSLRWPSRPERGLGTASGAARGAGRPPPRDDDRGLGPWIAARGRCRWVIYKRPPPRISGCGRGGSARWYPGERASRGVLRGLARTFGSGAFFRAVRPYPTLTARPTISGPVSQELCEDRGAGWRDGWREAGRNDLAGRAESLGAAGHLGARRGDPGAWGGLRCARTQSG